MKNESINYDLENEKPIIIIGGGRSGTTLLRYILNSHPNIYISEEISYHVWMSRFFGSFEKKLGQYFKIFSFLWLRLDPKVVLSKFSSDISEADSAQVYLEILKAKSAEYNKPRYGEKNPFLTHSLKQIFADYPNAKVINVVRDPRGNVFSHTTMPWSTPSMLLANRIVKEGMEKVNEFDDRILSVKLEDLISKPEKTARQLLDYVEEPWSNNLLEHSNYSLPNDGIPFPWLNEAAKGRRQKKLVWSEGMSAAWIRRVESSNIETIKRFNYPIHILDKEPNWMHRVGSLLGDMPKCAYSLVRITRLCVLFTFTKKSQSGKLQTLMHSLNPRAWRFHQEWDKNLPEPPSPVCNK